MARSGICKTCGKRIRPSAKDMSVGAASRKHYWRHHPDRMTAWRDERRWEKEGRRRRRSR